jgi:CBS domain-containing protein
MASNNVRSILVTRGKTLVGIFTGTDLACRVVAKGRDPDATKLADVMTPDPHTIGPQDDAVAAFHCMQFGGHRHLPVTEGKALVGMLSRCDVLDCEIDEIERQELIWREI